MLSIVRNRSISSSLIPRRAATVQRHARRQFWWSKGPPPESNDTSSVDSAVVEEEKSKDIVPMFGDLTPKPRQVLLLPLIRRPIFPGFIAAFVVKDDKVAEGILSSVESNSGFLGMFLRKSQDESELIRTEKDLHKVGMFASVKHIQKTMQGTQVFVLGHRRISLDRLITPGPPAIGEVTHWAKLNVDQNSNIIRAYTNELMIAIKELVKVNPLAQEQVAQSSLRMEFSDPFKLADLAAAMTTSDGLELQKVLEEADPERRLALALSLIRKEIEVYKIQKDIMTQVETKMSKQQREYLLKEQLKSIKQELGIEKDDKDALLNKFKEKLEIFKEHLKPEAKKVIDEEMEKMASLEKNSPEFNVTRAYLDWLTSLPWNISTEDTLNIKLARKVLDEDHFGLDDIKKRILEYIAVGKLKGSVNGKIICFIGPPGVGKTSIAKSIATALNRKFYRFSVGGLTDIAEIKGHRRTYIGAMPGKPIICLKSTSSMNPLVLIDEIDKLGRGYQGDPASALLELLDPNQNSNFVDHYLDVPVDFSKVLFVCTANDESTIPGPLKDRMEIIRLSGYDIPEKIAIAQRYLIPKALSEAGIAAVLDDYHRAVLKAYSCPLGSMDINFTDTVLDFLIRNYSRESGVRSLEKLIEQIARKIAFNYVQHQEENEISGEGEYKIDVTVDNLESFIGKPRYPQDLLFENNGKPFPAGIVMGLAWTPLGGCPIYIETSAVPITPSNGPSSVSIVTGQLGKVMNESVKIAYTFARQYLSKHKPENDFFKRHQIHLHIPEGSIEKDGPSAGIAMATCLLSLAEGVPVLPQLAMTGEITLTGKVLPVGGIKEKALAGKRAGAKVLILPASNKRDYDELPQYVKTELEVHFFSEYSEVYNLALCDSQGEK